MSHTATPTLNCHNCQHDLQALPEANYCPQCGQETVLHPPTLWEFVHEFITHYVALEGALWRSLGALLLRPGKLTQEYFHGRRKHYVLPLRLYLSASFVFFLITKMVVGGHGGEPQPSAWNLDEATLAAESPASGASGVKRDTAQAVQAQKDQKDHNEQSNRYADCATTPGSCSTLDTLKGQLVLKSRQSQGRGIISVQDDDTGSDTHATPGAQRAANDRYAACSTAPNRCGWLDTLWGRFIVKSRQADANHIDWQPRMMAAAPYAIFLMLPVFAGLLSAVYWRRRMAYGEHFVFSLHLHSFWFIALLADTLLPTAIDGWVLLSIPIYALWAMRQVYGGRWLPTVARAALLSQLYGVLLVAGSALLVGWVILNS